MNKTLFYIASIAIILSGCQKPKDHVELSGKITNPNSDKITITNPDNGYKKEIAFEEDGSFSDTLKVEEGRYRFFDGNEVGTIFLKNGNGFAGEILDVPADPYLLTSPNINHIIKC